MSNQSEHSGHRKRMKKRFLDYGLDTFEQHEILELALFYAIPMKDTNPTAHKLIDEFGSLSSVFDAPYDLLIQSGLTDNAATFIKLIPELLSVYMEDRFNNQNKIIKLEKLPEKFINKYLGKTTEMVSLLLMDSKFKELYCGIVSKGSITNADVNIPKICELSIRYSARYAIIAHNHPSGICLPSKADIKVTTRLYQALKLINIELLYHYIVAEDDCVSLYDAKVFFKSEQEYNESGVADIDADFRE